MAISELQKEEIRAKIDIAEVVSAYGYHLEHKNGALWCCCPFHNEKTASFRVDEARGTYHCFGCGEGGDAFDFVMKQEGLSFVDAVKKLADSVGIEIKETISPDTLRRKKLIELMTALALDFNKMLKKSKSAEPAREYLKARHLDDDAVDKFLIGYAPPRVEQILAWAAKRNYTQADLAAAGIIKLSDTEGRPPYFYFANRLVFSVKDKNGQVVAFSGRQLVEDKKSGKYINSPETAIFKKSRTFFAYDEARKHIVKAPNREAIICEGQIDCIRLHISGYPTAVAPLGTAFTEDHASLLHKVADTALLCFDDDAAGHKATIRTAQLLLAEGMPIRVLSLPDGDDPDSYILKHGKEAFERLISEKVESIVHFQIRAERTKETNAQDTNGEARVAKAVLETISKCRDKVLRTVLLKDAAKELGMGYATLEDGIAKQVKEAERVNALQAEQLIDEPMPGRGEDISNLPTVTEGAFLNFLLQNEEDMEVRKCIAELIPSAIFHSPMARKLVEAWLAGKTPETDPIREVVESLSDEEYCYFTRIVCIVDTEQRTPTSARNKVVYFARQLWYDFLVRRVKAEGITSADRKFIADSIKTLHSATKKGVVHLIRNFPHNLFQGGM